MRRVLSEWVMVLAIMVGLLALVWLIVSEWFGVQ